MKTKLSYLYAQKSKIEAQITAEKNRIIDIIVNIILLRNKLTMYELMNNKNIQSIQFCRHEIHYILHLLFCKKKNVDENLLFKMTLKEIGEVTVKGHANILNSLKAIENMMYFNKKYKENFTNFIKTLV